MTLAKLEFTSFIPQPRDRKKLENHDKNIELVFSYLDELTEKKENESNADCNEHDEQTAFGIILFVYIGIAIKGPDQEHDESDEGQGGDENGNSPIPDGQDTNFF